MKIILLLGFFLIFSLMASVSSVDAAKPDKFVKDNYIIKFKEGVKPNMKHDWKVTHKYSKIFNGLAVEIKNANALNRVINDDTIESVFPVEIFNISEPLLSEINTIPPDINEKQFIKPGTTRHGFDKNPSVNAGDGVTNVPIVVAIVDTGCTLEHPDLNYIECHDFTGSAEGFDDLNGHGTHTAGTVAAINNDFGVVGGAPGAGIIGLKVCGAGGGGSCPQNAILAAWDWLAINGKDKGVLVSNNSFGGARDGPVEDGNCGFTDGNLEHQAICAMADAGIVTVMSAGNSNADGVNFMGCGFDEVICVSAMEDSDGIPGGFGPTCRSDSPDDTIGGFSNYGPTVDISADGVCEPSTVPDCSDGAGICSDTGYLEISGTSMSGPQTAGGVALAIVHLYGFDGAQNREQVMAVNNFVKATGFDINSPDGFECNKPTGCTEPLLNAETYTFNPREPFHDVALTVPSVPNPVGFGFTQDIVFSTINVGTFTETYTVELRIDDELVFTDTVTLGELQSKNYLVEWIPDTFGPVIITTSIPDVPAEDSDPTNNGGITLTQVVKRIRDVAVISMIDVGEDNWVGGVACENCLRVHYKNLGNFAENLNVTISHMESGTVIFERIIPLQPGAGVIQTGLDVRKNIIVDGINIIKAEVEALPGEIDLENNIKLLSVIASEENRHYDIRAVLFFGDTICNEDENCNLRLWMTNEGTETISDPKLSYGIFENDILLQGARTPFTLETGNGAIVDFTFEPFSLSVGEHNLVGIGDYLNEYEERDETNNSKTLLVTVREVEQPEPIHDVAILSLTVPDVDRGDTGTVSAIIENQGNQDEPTVNIIVRLDGGFLERAVISLDKGISTQFDASFATDNLSEGTHTILLQTVIPIDDDPADNLKSADFEVIVGPPPDTPPTVMILNPVDGQTITDKVIIIVAAEDENGIAYVQLKLDGKNIKGALDEAPYILSWQSKSKKDGDYTLEAEACDNAGICASDTISITISNGKGKP